jgi:hypothetical protein
MNARLFPAALLLLLGTSGAFAGTTCVTPSGNCAIADAPPRSECFCATANGLVAGTVDAGNAGRIPQFCCTPSGRFGPDENAKAAVGQSCQAKLPNGTTMAGQALLLRRGQGRPRRGL